MALRVLLADESTTIKKVMQLALQDYGIEVKSVSNGLDVLSVAQSFKPDIIFVDVLLQKKTGYDVCLELKNDPQLSITPVILMWSGFMELDESKAQKARPEARLEKPFDTNTLRDLIQKFVPRTTSNIVSSYLTFPQMPNFVESKPENQPEENLTLAEDIHEEEESASQFSDEPAEDFRQVPLSQQDFAKFKINVSENDLHEGAGVEETYFDEEEDGGQFVLVEDLEELSNSINSPNPNLQQTKKSAPAPFDTETTGAFIPAIEKTNPNLSQSFEIDQTEIEKAVREKTEEIIRSIAWKILPEITERVVREEIQKLLKDAEQKVQLKL